jgi:hypothetical protein
MDRTDKRIGPAWIWAIGINLVAFVLIGVALAKIPAPQAHQAAGTNATQAPGATFGQMTQLIGGQPAQPANAAQQPSTLQTPPTGVGQASNQWIDEFYLDRGPAISFAPRLNPDGTPRSLPTDQTMFKSPTYEDQATTISLEDINYPTMNPPTFHKSELPPELRNFTYTLTVRVSLDARGRPGKPEILTSSGNPYVDQFILQKIAHSVTFTPATRKDNGQPVPTTADFPIFWN